MAIEKRGNIRNLEEGGLDPFWKGTTNERGKEHAEQKRIRASTYRFRPRHNLQLKQLHVFRYPKPSFAIFSSFEPVSRERRSESPDDRRRHRIQEPRIAEEIDKQSVKGNVAKTMKAQETYRSQLKKPMRDPQNIEEMSEKSLQQ
jgi:hypothetical protein